MNSNNIQFAVVREDPKIELEVIERAPLNIKDIYLVGSGGCTAFAIKRVYPEAHITLVDPNPAQIDLIQKKLRVLQESNPSQIKREFGVGIDNSKSLTGCGNFESLFRSFRYFIYEFVLDREGWHHLFSSEPQKIDLEKSIFNSKYWSLAFELYFSNGLLLAMFGPDAIQHAIPNSYPKYFQGVIEKGLKNSGAKINYFLHHIFLGHYLEESLPIYLSDALNMKSSHSANRSWAQDFEYNQTTANDGPHFGRFDLISLSNIFDWMESSEIKRLIKRVSLEMKSGAWIIYRQLNNSNDLRPEFGPSFMFDDDNRSEAHLKSDRSLFYSGIHIGRKIPK